MIELEKRRQRAAEGEADDSYVPDFVDIMLGAPEDDVKVLEDGLVIKQAGGLFVAGTETSSTTMEWDMAELVLHPELRKRAQKEVNAVVGLELGLPCARVRHSTAPFLQAIVKETFRMHNSPPLGFPRESTAPVEALGYKISAETRIIYNAYTIYRDPVVYESPFEFNPDRFLQQHHHANHLSAFDSFELILFGDGRRMCPGYNLGNAVVHFMLANLIHSCDWTLPDGGSIDVNETELVGPIECLKSSLDVSAEAQEWSSCI